jgi:hypothetical protein
VKRPRESVGTVNLKEFNVCVKRSKLRKYERRMINWVENRVQNRNSEIVSKDYILKS